MSIGYGFMRGAQGVLISMSLVAMGALASAQGQERRIISNPPLLELKRAAPRSLSPLRAAPFSAPLQLSNEASLDLNVIYTTGRIYNPATAGYDQVYLRSYQGTSIDPNAPFVAPTLDIKPGETIRISLNNKLPADPSCTNDATPVNTPHCFNGTNLHTHGLWVNPSGNGDNVLISINPGVSFQYEYNIPSDHPAGTFWYHTHRHGSTALQVSSGMAGALIIRGNRLPTPTQNGDIDTLLRPTNTQAFKERVLVFQQIQYACRDASNNIKVVPPQPGNPAPINQNPPYFCAPGDVGTVEGYDQFGPGTWGASGRQTSINGHIVPVFNGLRAGDVERWRSIHGGVRDTINLQFRKLRDGVTLAQALASAGDPNFIKANCTGTPLTQHLVAADGLTIAAALKTTQAVLQPGYRWDTLMVFPQAGPYCMVDATIMAVNPPVTNPPTPTRPLLGFVDVQAGPGASGDLTQFITSALIKAATVNMPQNIRDNVIADLQNSLTFSRFIQHPTVTDAEVTGKQSLAFNIDVTKSPIVFEVDGKPFDPIRIDRTLILGGVDEWTLKSDFVSHPFHIHVNPFQVVKILDPNGVDVSGPDAVDDPNKTGVPDPQYRGLKGTWKDTLWVKNIGKSATNSGQYTLIVRTRYQRYIGDYVLHCHILDHEDQGMMQHIRVALPNGLGGVSKGHAH
jgi:L-ascorbate oxidase